MVEDAPVKVVYEVLDTMGVAVTVSVSAVTGFVGRVMVFVRDVVLDVTAAAKTSLR